MREKLFLKMHSFVQVCVKISKYVYIFFHSSFFLFNEIGFLKLDIPGAMSSTNWKEMNEYDS